MECRWPEKIKHADKAAATAAIYSLRRSGRGSPDDSVYPCGNHWHVGHSRVSLQKRIKRALLPSRPKRKKR